MKMSASSTREDPRHRGDGYEMPKVELIVVDVLRVLQKWKDRSLVGKPRILALNNECPKAEWGTDFNGKPKGPWHRVDARAAQLSHPLGFLDDVAP
jgi:hypothetical protein